MNKKKYKFTIFFPKKFNVQNLRYLNEIFLKICISFLWYNISNDQIVMIKNSLHLNFTIKKPYKKFNMNNLYYLSISALPDSLNV